MLPSPYLSQLARDSFCPAQPSPLCSSTPLVLVCSIAPAPVPASISLSLPLLSYLVAYAVLSLAYVVCLSYALILPCSRPLVSSVSLGRMSSLYLLPINVRRRKGIVHDRDATIESRRRRNVYPNREGTKRTALSPSQVARVSVSSMSICSAAVLLGFLIGLQHMGSHLSTRAQATASSSSPPPPPTRPPPLRPPPSSRRPSQSPRHPPSRRRTPPVVVEVVRLVEAKHAEREARTG